jgi:hypothetical protein
VGLGLGSKVGWYFGGGTLPRDFPQRIAGSCEQRCTWSEISQRTQARGALAKRRLIETEDASTDWPLLATMPSARTSNWTSN